MGNALGYLEIRTSVKVCPDVSENLDHGTGSPSATPNLYREGRECLGMWGGDPLRGAGTG